MIDTTIRASRDADEAAILELARTEMKAHEDLDERFRLRKDALDRYAVYLRGRIRDIDASVYVAERDGVIVGIAIGSIRRQESFFEQQRFGYVSDLVVAPHLRRQGIGSALYHRIVLWFRGLGIDVIRMHVASRSEEARAFWRKLGATEFLQESWIDVGPVPVEAPEPPTPEASPIPTADDRY